MAGSPLRLRALSGDRPLSREDDHTPLRSKRTNIADTQTTNHHPIEASMRPTPTTYMQSAKTPMKCKGAPPTQSIVAENKYDKFSIWRQKQINSSALKEDPVLRRGAAQSAITASLEEASRSRPRRV